MNPTCVVKPGGDAGGWASTDPKRSGHALVRINRVARGCSSSDAIIQKSSSPPDSTTIGSPSRVLLLPRTEAARLYTSRSVPGDPGRRNGRTCRSVFSRREWYRKRYAEDPEYRRRTLASNRAYAAAHKAELNEHQRRRWKTNPKYREEKRARRYGISVQDYKIMLARQRGACAICRKKSEQTLCIDHCHKTGKVRGLLCRKCNIALGFYGDDPRLTRAATAYLEASQSDEQT